MQKCPLWRGCYWFEAAAGMGRGAGAERDHAPKGAVALARGLAGAPARREELCLAPHYICRLPFSPEPNHRHDRRRTPDLDREGRGKAL